MSGDKHIVLGGSLGEHPLNLRPGEYAAGRSTFSRDTWSDEYRTVHHPPLSRQDHRVLRSLSAICSIPAGYGRPMAPEEDSPTSRFASLANPTYRKLWWGGSFIFLAMQVQLVARGWLAYELIGTNTALGGVLIGFGVATLIAIPTGGVIADRFNKRTILVLCQIANTITALVIALAITSGIIAYWMIVAASVAGGASLSLLAPARMAMTAEIVDRSLLTNAVMLSTDDPNHRSGRSGPADRAGRLRSGRRLLRVGITFGHLDPSDPSTP